MNKFAIYTIMVGGYDEIIQPAVIDSRFDYILFSNDFNTKQIGIWTVKSIPTVLNNDNKRLSRYPKTHPDSMLSNYEASLYIDANVQINDKWVYNRFIELFDSGIDYAGIKLILTGKNCIYEHAIDMWLVGAEHDYNAIKQCSELFKRGFPQHWGLNENNVIYRRHSAKMQKANEEWWWWIKNYSYRDQFSYMYCLWKHQIKISYFLPEGEDTRNGNHFILINHSASKGNSKKWVHRDFFEKIRLIIFRSYSEEKKNVQWRNFYVKCYNQGKLNLWTLTHLTIFFYSILKSIYKKIVKNGKNN